MARHRKPSLPARTIATTTRNGTMLALTAATGLGVILADGACQAVTMTPAAATRTTTTWTHRAHLNHLARLAGRRSYHPATLTAYRGAARSSFQACVIARESGGNAQVMNASGHWGLYQFSEQTWVAYGGSRASFGHASVAEQNRVFANAMARGGRSNWAPYDGC